jgi:hypothetical protein
VKVSGTIENSIKKYGNTGKAYDAGRTGTGNNSKTWLGMPTW